MLFQERQRIVDLAMAAQLPGVYPDRPFADGGSGLGRDTVTYPP
jgi:hypothetical protein